jgi:hypothetical protein
LEHQLRAVEVKPNPVKIEVIQKMKPPVDISGVQKFLELISYYRKFIRNYSKIMES